MSNAVLTNISQDELLDISGGFLLTTVLFTIIGYEVTVGACIAAGAALGLVAGGAVVIG